MKDKNDLRSQKDWEKGWQRQNTFYKPKPAATGGYIPRYIRSGGFKGLAHIAHFFAISPSRVNKIRGPMSYGNTHLMSYMDSQDYNEDDEAKTVR